MNEIRKIFIFLKQNILSIISFLLIVNIFAFLNNFDLYTYLGESPKQFLNLMEISYIIVVKLFFVYIDYKYFIKDLEFLQNIIFQRVSKNRWIFKKIFSIIFINTIIIFFMIGMFRIYFVEKIYFTKIISIILLHSVLSFIACILYNVNLKKEILPILMLILVITNVPIIKINILNIIQNIYLVMLFTILIAIIMILNFNKKNTRNISGFTHNFSKGLYKIEGKNGSGKTTKLLQIANLIKNNGNITFDFNKIKIRGMFGVVLLNEEYKGITFLKELYLLSCKDKNKINKNIKKWSKIFEIDNLLDKKISKYSSGNKIKLILVSVFMEEPNVILLDEPYNFLDTKTKDILNKVIISELDKNKTIIYTSHRKEKIDNQILEKIVCD